jgi:ubiquinone biosynthesis protein
MSRPAAAKRSRFVKAYTTTFVVIFSYLLLRFVGRFMPRRRYETKLYALHRRNARRIERTILVLQGMYIKVGQLISIMTNFLPEEFRAELEGLQDQVPPRPYADIAKRLREELGQEPEELFAELNHTPISSASIGQVHVARLPSGEQVAVKVQYPGIERIVQLDLSTLKRILRIVEFFIGDYGLDAVHAEVSEMIAQELDFMREAHNIERIGKNLESLASVSCPKVYWELTRARVLTTAFVDGVKISNLERLDELGIDRRALAERVVAAYCTQIFRDGVYHADPHPGNLLVVPARPGASGGTGAEAPGDAPELVFLDFGAVAVLSEAMRRGIIDFLQGVLINDTEKIITAMRGMGFVARGQDPEIFERVVTYFHEKLVVEFPIDKFSLSDIKIDPQKSLENLADLRRMNISIRDLTAAFHVPKDYIFLERTVLLLTGLCTHLDPAMNPMAVIRPYLQEFMLGKEGDWSQFLLQLVRDGLVTAVSLPGDAKRFMSRAMRGDLQINFRGLDEPAELIYALGHQLIYALLAITGAGAAVLMHYRGDWLATRWILGGAAFFTLLLLASMWRNRGYRRRRRGRR